MERADGLSIFGHVRIAALLGPLVGELKRYELLLHRARKGWSSRVNLLHPPPARDVACALQMPAEIFQRLSKVEFGNPRLQVKQCVKHDHDALPRNLIICRNHQETQNDAADRSAIMVALQPA